MVAKSINKDGGRKCWIIKTTEGGPGKIDHWNDFKMDNVIAVGWHWVRIDPAKFNNYEDFSKRLYSRKYNREDSLPHIASTIYKFTHDWQCDDLVVICEGYAANQLKKVRLHGFALAGDYFFDPKSAWRWIYKRNAEIKSIEKDVPKLLFVKSFGMGSLRQTIHGPFAEKQFSVFSQQVQKLYSDLEL